MALKPVKGTDQQLPPHRLALTDNQKAIRAVRTEIDAVNAKDRQAAGDIALADATQARMQTIQEEMDTARAEASYDGAPAPDLRHLEKQLQDEQTLLKAQSNVARAAARIREKYSADLARLNAVLTEHAQQSTRLLWLTLREEELAGLAAEFLEKEQQFLAIHQKAFAAALAVDTISKEQAFGQFVGSGNIAVLNISRPTHEAFNPTPLTAEQAQAARQDYMNQVARGAAALVAELQGT